VTKRIAFRIAALVLGLFVVIAGIELAANVYLYARDGRYVPARQRLDALGNTFTNNLTRGRSGCRYVDTLFPHPYLAFVHHANPPCGLTVNNIGLFGPDFPSDRPDDRFVVLLTGGSVAAQFAGPGPEGVPYLESILNREYVSPTGRPFLILNGGDGSWRQPQQTILFLLYADAVHAVVTLDGYNERYMVGASVRFEFPSNNFMDVNPLVNSAYSFVVKQWMLGQVYGYAAANRFLSRSEAAYIILARIDASLRQQLQSAQPNTTINTIFQLPRDWDEERRVAWADRQYRKYIRAMDAIAAQNGALVAHFLQPVPALGKPLTDEEKAVVGDLSYRARYQRIMSDVLAMADEGTPIFSLLDLFEHNTHTLYADVIHLRQSPDGASEGHQLMAERMATVLAGAWHLRRRGSIPGTALR
jgi:hypothetical protein